MGALGELGCVEAWEQLYRKGNVNVSGWLRVDKCLWILTELEDRNKRVRVRQHRTLVCVCV